MFFKDVNAQKNERSFFSPSCPISTGEDWTLPQAEISKTARLATEQVSLLFLGPWGLHTSKGPQLFRWDMATEKLTCKGNSTKLKLSQLHKGLRWGKRVNVQVHIWRANVCSNVLLLTTSPPMQSLWRTYNGQAKGHWREVTYKSPLSITSPAFHTSQNKTEPMALVRWPSAWTNPHL